MAGVAVHVCSRTDDDGRQVRPEMATCGTCDRSWCFACYPTPASLCPWCNGDSAGVKYAHAAIPPRQARALRRV